MVNQINTRHYQNVFGFSLVMKLLFWYDKDTRRILWQMHTLNIKQYYMFISHLSSSKRNFLKRIHHKWLHKINIDTRCYRCFLYWTSRLSNPSYNFFLVLAGAIQWKFYAKFSITLYITLYPGISFVEFFVDTWVTEPLPCSLTCTECRYS